MILTAEVNSEKVEKYKSKKTGEEVESISLCLVDKDPVREARCGHVLEYPLRGSELEKHRGALTDKIIKIGVSKMEFFMGVVRLTGAILPDPLPKRA